MFSKSLLVTLLCTLAATGFAQVEPADESPSKQFTLETSEDGVSLISKTTNQKTLLIDWAAYDGGRPSFEGAYWSPDSSYVAIELEDKVSRSVEMCKITGQEATPVEFLPIPKKLDREPRKIRHGQAFGGWINSKMLWIISDDKNMSFRYRFNRAGKLFCDKSEDD